MQRVLRDRYEIVRPLGAGGISNVYLAHDRTLGRDVVVKTIRQADERSRSLLLREASLLADIDSRWVPASIDFFLDGEEVFLVQEHIDAAPLDDWLAGRWPYEIVELFADLARGLFTFHQKDIVHRDLKPSNVLVDSRHGEARAIILDFGVAVRTREIDVLTHTGSFVVGTALYMAPETWRGDQPAPPGDVFALGTMLFGALAGELPWASHGSVAELARSVLEGPSDEKLELLKARAPAPLAALIRETLAREPAERPPADRVAERLAEIAKKLTRPAGTAAGPPPRLPSPPTGAVGAVKKERPPGEVAAAARDQRLPWVLPLAAALAAGVALALALVPATTALQLIAAFVGLATLGGSYHLRRREAREAQRAGSARSGIEARIDAIERRLAEVGSVSQTIVAQFAGMREQLDPDRLVERLRASVVAAMRDVHLGDPKSDVDQLIRALRTLAGREDAPPPLHKRASTWLGLAGALVTVTAGTVGIAGKTNLWSPNRQPVVERFGPEDVRAIRGVPLELEVAARDPDGDPLTYTFAASSGSVESAGPMVLWRSDPDGEVSIVEITARISDGRVETPVSRSVRVNHPPRATLVVPRGIAPGETVRLTVDADDVDGDGLTYRWQVSCGTLDRTDGPAVYLTAPEAPCRLEVRSRVSDAWESVDAEAIIDTR